MKITYLAIGLLTTILFASSAFAQSAQLGNVVSACGTPNGSTYVVNTNRPETVDPNGNHCTGTTIINPPGSPVPTTAQASQNFVANQVSVGATATLIIAARPNGRNAVTIENLGTTPVYLGGSGVTAGNGMFLAGIVGAQITIPFSGAVYGTTVAGTQPVSFMETY